MTVLGQILSTTDIQSKISIVVGTTGDIGYVTDGTADDVQIQAALAAVNSAGGGRVVLQAQTFNLTAKVLVYNDTTLEGVDQSTTILRMGSGLNLTCLGNFDTTNGNSFIRVRNLTLDQQGATQTAGGGSSFTGLFDSTIENVTVENSYVFNLFIGSLAGTSLTGTLTFTLGDTTVTGSGTAFTTELAVGDIVRSAGNHFQRVHSITSNTALELDRTWGWATESGVAAKKNPANARNRLINCTFNGTTGTSDNVGLGLFDDSLVQGCISRNSTGYGFGPDHANRAKFIGNTMYANSNAGIGMETCGYCVVKGNVSYGNGSGVYLLSGSYRNTIEGNQCYRNTNGIAVTYNNTSFPLPDENDIRNNVCERNSTAGINVDGASKTTIAGNRAANNGSLGIRIQTGNSVIPDKTQIIGNNCYDNQDVKTQARGIYVVNGTSTVVIDNASLTADHTTAGLTDSGTGTIVINTDGTTNAAGKVIIGAVISAPLLDTNGNTVVGSTATASAVNYINITNAAAAGTVTLAAAGTDASIPLIISNKGNAIFALRPGTNSTNAIRLQSSSGGANVLVADTTNSRVGINKTTPTVTLDVAGIIGLLAGTSTTIGKAGGTISVNTTATGNVGSGEDDLMTYAVPANALAVNNDRIKFRASGTIANNVNTKRLRVKYGGTTVLDTGAVGFPISTAIQWVLEGEVIRTGAATQKCSANLSTNNASLASYVGYSTAAETLSGAVTLKLTGEAVSDNDVVNETLCVSWESAP